MSDLPTATIAPLKLPYAKVSMLCEFRTCSTGICGRRVIASKNKPLCYKHYSKNMMFKCSVPDCENGTLSHSGICVKHGQNKHNMRVKRAEERMNNILPPQVKKFHCENCNINIVNVPVHNKSCKHKKAVFLNSLEYEFQEDQEDRDHYRLLMDQIKNYYYEKRINKSRGKTSPPPTPP